MNSGYRDKVDGAAEKGTCDIRASGAALNDNASSPIDRSWVARAMAILADERRRAADTPLIRLPVPEIAGVDFYLKDETAHPSGSLKHRLAHALFAHAICSGEIGPGTVIVEASSGSTAISEAWFAHRLGLPFVAVIPAATAPAKIIAIREAGGEVVCVAPGTDLCVFAADLADQRGGHFMNQFARAAEATDWRGSNNIAQSLFAQMQREEHPVPAWIVVGAGTGGTSATIGRYIRLRPELARARLCVVDPEGSAFFAAYSAGDRAAIGRTSPVVEGIGRACVEPGFNPKLIDAMLAVPDVASVAGAHWLRDRLGEAFGPSTGTNVVGALLLGQAMQRQGRTGSVVTLACDTGARYAETIYDAKWCAVRRFDLRPWADLPAKLAAFAFPALPG
ncbi:pyridoxal-phosphate dependent enzyme [Sphingomonas sp. BT-65]|uniref:PLP-dependent cysteine synthase family protein n=1 Tax=Sphingomonas sp. BT-65 TaxID=2989821 RepID=UPI0022363340|nr:pyridoxal-phosphate dependent enzyme [Sphingomonas sp. BT-65]MCW4460795.1 pyridoxal-phosphate dependent enzyme [Sphingomonas sp. BT-65]